ncbi:MAG: YqgE/AlgH family protein [Halothiobacillaceae bacterium]|jgi:putative transcriptional regulator|nr:YqgE/AlgH family protein [Halothiobacillaceae bacterium]MDY0050420.1 YqgE/AlgH family protein [Halothiobacillaceae bacterium]
MNSPLDLTNHLLIAMPGMGDPNFAQTVTYVCEHNEKGAMGIVINRLLELNLGDILDHMGIDCTQSAVRAHPVHLGGPVQVERGFVLHSPAGGWDSTLNVTEDIALTTSRDILQAIAQGAGPSRLLIALGYAGWGAGQLEQEMKDNAWLSTPAQQAILFDVPVEQRWHAAAGAMGIDLNLLSSEAGHA